MILIPAGAFVMGLGMAEVKKLAERYDVDRSCFECSMPRRETYLEAYYIDKYPVTNADYEEFCRQTGRAWPVRKVITDENAGSPAVGLALAEAEAYAAWVGKRLPTEEEWEKAARGPRGLLFAWGNQWEPERCVSAWSGRNAPASVKAYPNGASPYGIMDMTGNVFEWTSSLMREDSPTVRGGSFRHSEPLVFLAAYRGLRASAVEGHDDVGFRCVMDIERGDQNG